MSQITSQFLGRLTSRCTSPPADRKILEAAESELLIRFPQEYVDLVTATNGVEGFSGKSYMMIFAVQHLREINQAAQVERFAPGLLIFGSNGSGTSYAFDTRYGHLPVVEFDDMEMSLDCIVVRGNSFAEFLSSAG